MLGRKCIGAAKKYEQVDGGVGEELYDLAHAAAMALQIICPTGAKHIFMKFQETSGGWDNVASYHPKELCSTRLGRITRLEDPGARTPIWRSLRFSLDSVA